MFSLVVVEIVLLGWINCYGYMVMVVYGVVN